MFYRSFGIYNEMVTFIFRFNPMKGQGQVKSVRTSKCIFSIKNRLVLSSFVSVHIQGVQRVIQFISKNVIYASRTEVRKHKVRVGKGSQANDRMQMFVWDKVRTVKSSYRIRFVFRKFVTDKVRM